MISLFWNCINQYENSSRSNMTSSRSLEINQNYEYDPAQWQCITIIKKCGKKRILLYEYNQSK